jgi:hypothetical protein
VYLRVTSAARGCHGRWARRRDVLRPLAVKWYLGKARFRFRSTLESERFEPVSNRSAVGSRNWAMRADRCPTSSCRSRVNVEPKYDHHWPGRPSPPSQYDSSSRVQSRDIIINISFPSAGGCVAYRWWWTLAVTGQRLSAPLSQRNTGLTLAQRSPCFSELFFF